MTHQPTVIKLGDIAEVIAREFPARDMLTVYVGSNAATPTASLDAITEALKVGWPKLPYLGWSISCCRGRSRMWRRGSRTGSWRSLFFPEQCPQGRQ